MTDLLDRLKRALADRYTLERELGRGGMAIVYLARDQKLDREVALKVLRPEFAASLGGERFLREIQIAAKLHHPNILGLHDCGEADGQLYYTMPFVEGESLRDRLNREKQLPIDDALQITREVADALGYAHSMGLVHRDIKPENILFQGGHAVVADFGIARAVTEAGAETLTETGLAVGTPAYMSPEQATGTKELDARTDIYALGCVLYEMLSGDAPYTASTPQAVLAKKLSEPTPRISVVRETVPPSVEATLERALAKAPADRFQTAQQLADALVVQPADVVRPEPMAAGGGRHARPWLWRWAVGLAAIAVVVTGGILLSRGGGGGPVTAAGVEDSTERLVVVPFENRTGDTAAADWGLIAAGLITREIDRAAVVTVVPARVVQDMVREADPSASLSVEQIARRTGARYAVAGSYSLVAGGIRFDMELMEAETSELLQTPDPVTGPADSLEAMLAALADRATAATVMRLGQGSSPWQQRRSSPPSMEVVRFELAVSDLFCRAEWEEVIDQSQAASEIVQAYPPLLSRLLYAYGNLGREREWDSVYALLEPRMNELTTTERLWVEWAHGIYRGNHVEATRAVEQLYRIQPGMAGFHAGITALRMNRFEEAIERLRHHDLEAPCFRRWYPWWAAMTEAYHMVGRYEEALAVAQEGRERFPHVWMLLYWEAISHAGLGNLEAVDSLLDVIEGLPVQRGYSPGQQITRLALELRTLGYREAFEGAMERAQAWFAARPSTELRLPRGAAFYYAERWSDADTLFAALSAVDPDNVDYRGVRAVALVHLGMNDEALEIDAWLAQQQSPFGLPGAHTRWRAAIAAALGHRAEAVQLLQQAYDEGMDLGHNHRRDPEWEPLRDYGPYREFVGPRG